jgi:cell division protein FtsB
MVLSLRDRLIYNIKDNVMKLTKEQIDKIKQTVLDLERKIEEMEQQDYITFDLGKDLQNLSYMVDVLSVNLFCKERS